MPDTIRGMSLNAGFRGKRTYRLLLPNQHENPNSGFRRLKGVLVNGQ